MNRKVPWNVNHLRPGEAWWARWDVPVYRNFLTLNAFYGIGLLVALATNSLVAREIGVSDFGRFALFNSVVAVAIMFGDLGINTGIVRFTAGEGNGTVAREFRSLAFWMKTGVGVVILVGGGTLLAPFAARAVYGSPDVLPVIRWALLAMLPASLVGYFQAVFQAEKDFAAYGLFGVLPTTARLILVGAALLLSSLTLGHVLAFTVAANVLVAGFLVIRARRNLVPLPPNGGAIAREMLSYSVWIFLPTCLSTLIDQSGLLMLPLWNGAESVGVYGAAYSIWLIYSAVLSSIATLLFPRVINQEKPYYRRYIRALVPYFVLALIGCVLLAFGSRVIIVAIFGRSFADAGPALMIFTATFFLRFVSVPFGILIWTLRRPTVMVKFTLVQFATVMALNAWLIPRYGILGAAVSHFVVFGIFQILFSPIYAYTRVIR